MSYIYIDPILSQAGKFNVLFASDIAEEGLDVKIVELIINFDSPETLKSLIQRRGRARARNSITVLLLSASQDGEKQLTEMKELVRQDAELNQLVICGLNGSHVLGDGIDACERYVVPLTGATVDSRTSLTLLMHYCQRLPSIKRANSLPTFWQTKLSEGIYQCAVLLPNAVPSRLRCHIGRVMRSKAVAKGSVALECIEKLHLAGELDDWLRCEKRTKATTGILATGGIKGEEEPRRETVEIKYIPDTLTPRGFEYDVSESGFIMHFYAVEVVGGIPEGLRACASCSTLLSSLDSCGLSLPSPFPSEVESFPLAFKHEFVITLKLKYLGRCNLSSEETRQMQRYHRAVLCWEYEGPGPPKIEIAPEHWGSSGNGIHYMIFPIYSIPYATYSPSNGEFITPADWLVRLESAADDAQGLIRHLLLQREHASSTIPKSVYYKYTKHQENLVGKIISQSPMVISSPFPEGYVQKRVTLRDVMGKMKGKASTFFEFYLAKELIPVEDLKAMRDNSSHQLLPVYGVPGRGAAENLLHEINADTAGQHLHRPTVTYMLPELCFSLGSLIDYNIGTMVPGLMWRVQSLFLAKECLDYIHLLSRQVDTEDIHLPQQQLELQFPNLELMLEAMTPRMAREAFDSERIEMLGDSVIKFLIGVELYRLYPNKHEGYLTKLRSDIGKPTSYI
jgi:hypothetical protein